MIPGGRRRHLIWIYLWQLHHQTMKLIRMDWPQGTQDKTPSSQGNHRQERIGDEQLEAEDIIPGGEDQTGDGDSHQDEPGPRQKWGLLLGPLLFALLLAAPTPAGMNVEAKRALAAAVWIAIWWVTEAIPIPATSLLPIVLFPLTGAVSVADAAAPYSNPNVFLFLGGFTIAMCIERWNLHRRIALYIIFWVGTTANRLILGFMVATAFLSMWISNTASTMMMMPIGLAVILQIARMIQEQGVEGIDVRQGHFTFGTCLMLSIAYAASIGGVATLIGSPPNIIFAGVAEQLFDVSIGFFQWFTYGLPISVVFLFLAWLYMTRWAYPPQLEGIPGGREYVEQELKGLGPMTRPEKSIAAVFTAVALAWVSRPFLLEALFPEINDALIAIAGAVVTFIIPVRAKGAYFLNDWDTALRIPWGILLLFGGGLSMAGAFADTGLAEWMGEHLSALAGFPMIVIMLAVVTMVIYLTEVTSNTAITSMMMPIMASMAAAMEVHPFALMITAATAASYAFMLPVATPPNAVIFGSGYMSIPQMVRAGVWLNLLGVVLLTLFAYFWLPVIWRIDIGIFPPAWK